MAAVLLVAGCDVLTDAATRLAFEIEAAARSLERDGDRVTLRHEVPSRPGECEGPYTVQLDKVGALVFWCRDAEGNVLASPGTSHHRRFVRTPETYYLHKQAGEPLVIELERRAGEVVIVDVQ
jgi:hypothetical protein